LLHALRFTRLSNAAIELGGQVGVTGSVPLNPPVGSATFFVRRVAAGQAATAELTATDGCGAWPTFVGGGPGAY
jgi:hypothetical protein